VAEIEITLPTVQYGNVKVRATPEELGLSSVSDAYDVGVAAAVYLNVFTQGFKKGSTLDVSAPETPSRVVTEEQAQRHLDEGLDGVTELHEGYNDDGPGDVQAAANEARDKAAHDAAYADSPNDGPEPAPWESTVDAKPKPWETGAKAPAKVAEIDWS
jgi:hypothetical protein